MGAPTLFRRGGGVAVACALSLLAACAPPLAPDDPAPGVVNTDATPVAVRPTSPQSAELRAYLASVQASQLRQGLLRQDGGGPDTPYTATMLARNFEQIAFFDEFGPDGRSAGGEAVLRRWAGPIHVQTVFGATVSASQRRMDSADVQQFVSRLARVTGHPIRIRARDPNFYVLFAGEDDRNTELDTIGARLGVSLDALKRLRRDTYCAVVAFGDGQSTGTYTTAVAVIRAENPDLLRLSCIHEEMAQALGLPNDSPRARPSIFNDDDEFALLTSHDEALLGILYDAALTPGQSRNTARPIVQRLARQATGEEEAPPLAGS